MRGSIQVQSAATARVEAAASPSVQLDMSSLLAFPGSSYDNPLTRSGKRPAAVKDC
jgi:hypothetical protein